MSDIAYAHQKFMAAVSVLALSTDTLQQRLVQAIIEEHVFVLDAKDLPEHLQNLFTKLMNAVTSNRLGKIDEVVNRMSDEDAARSIQLILELESGLAEERYSESNT
jgi:hypothetical protein